MLNKRLYLRPECELEPNYGLSVMLCQSPSEGGLEDVEYEDWVTQG